MKYLRTINYYETDRMNFVHHSNYIRYFEEARVWIMETNGMGYAAVEAMGLMIPVLSVNVKYIKHITFNDKIEIDTRITKFTGVKMTVEYNVYKDGELTTQGESTHCFLEKSTLSPVNLKRAYPDVYTFFQKLYELTSNEE